MGCQEKEVIGLPSVAEWNMNFKISFFIIVHTAFVKEKQMIKYKDDEEQHEEVWKKFKIKRGLFLNILSLEIFDDFGVLN